MRKDLIKTLEDVFLLPFVFLSAWLLKYIRRGELVFKDALYVKKPFLK